MFERFYAIYPRKVARLDAERAWRQMTRTYDPEAIIAGAERFARQCANDGTEKQFQPYPASWLRSGRWLDEEHVTVKAEPMFRPCRTVDELKAFYESMGKPITPEIARARSVEDLPAFARMVPKDWSPNVVQMKRGAA